MNHLASLSKLYKAYQSSGSVSTDTRQIKSGDMFFALKGPNFDGNAYAHKALEAGASHIVIDNPDYLKENPAYLLVADSLIALQDLARHHRRQLEIPVIGITGSNGKTTTKELLYAILSTAKKTFATKGNLNNHIGVPLSLLAISSDTEIAIIEMGANQPGDIKELVEIALPTHGLLTNIGQAHLERFLSIEGVAKTKGELFDFIREHGGTAFVNIADARVLAQAAGIKEQITYGSPHAHYHHELLANTLTGMEISIARPGPAGPLLLHSQISGSYNALNILAAATVAHHLGLSDQHIAQGIHDYLPKNNRSQLSQIGAYTLWLDAYNANPSSMRASISHVFGLDQEGITLILGDMFELGEGSEEAHADLGRFINQYNPSMVIGVGAHMQHMVEALDGSAVWYATTEEAQKNLLSHLKESRFLLVKGSRGMALERLLEVLPT